MITVKQVKENIYAVTEHLHAWRKSRTTTFYYDIENLLISEKESFPNNDITRKLTDSQIDWFNRHYLPKVNNSATN